MQVRISRVFVGFPGELRFSGGMSRLGSLLATLGILAGCLFPPMAQSAPASSSIARRWLSSASPTPVLQIPESPAEWGRRRGEIRAKLWELLGDLPRRPVVPEVRTVSREPADGYTVERFEFDNGAGAKVPGVLLLPANLKSRAPAVLYCHWHGGQYDSGKQELFQTNAVPEAPGPALARRGYVVLAIDAYCFGERNGAGPGGPAEKGSPGEMTASKFQLWLGRSLWGLIVRDDLMALDYLAQRPEVDADNIAVTGISMGATRTWWLMALDDRPKTGVAVGCLTRYQDLVLNEGLKYHGIYYFIPGMLRHFDTEAVVALAAPRPMLFMTGDLDLGSPVSGVRAIGEKVRAVYQVYGREEAFQNDIFPGVGHVYTPEMWGRTLAWLDARLKPKF